ncbi:MAG: TIGR03546 family protein [Gemmatimonadales bacterium]
MIKLIQSIVKALHSEGTPGQVAAGLALGSILGLTPLTSLHNAVVLALIVILNVSFPAAMLGWAVFVPLGFALDPVFDAVGRRLLLDTPALVPAWTALDNMPVVPLTDFNNTVVLGSVVLALALFVPLFFVSRWGVTRYRATVAERLRRSALYKTVTASKLYNLYRLFRPQT